MIFKYKQILAEIIYSPVTKSYYGELLAIDQLICFQARTKLEAEDLIKNLCQEYYYSDHEQGSYVSMSGR